MKGNVKVALAAAIGAALAAVVATIWIGANVREDTVVARPYEEGLRHTEACDLGAGPCTRPLPGGGDVTLDLGPRPLRTMRELTVRVSWSWPVPPTGRVPREVEMISQSGKPIPVSFAVSFSMPGMEMGENRVPLLTAPPDGLRGFMGKAVLVKCPSGKRDWIAEVSIDVQGEPRRAARFPFRVEE